MADKERTHAAFTIQRVSKRMTRWLEVGDGRIDDNGAHVYLDRLPIGGFTGYVWLRPKEEPPIPPEPQRPGTPADSDTDQDEL